MHWIEWNWNTPSAYKISRCFSNEQRAKFNIAQTVFSLAKSIGDFHFVLGGGEGEGGGGGLKGSLLIFK